jgi:hypothetical protein
MKKEKGMSMAVHSTMTVTAMSRVRPMFAPLGRVAGTCAIVNSSGRVVTTSDPQWVTGSGDCRSRSGRRMRSRRLAVAI